MVILCAKQYTYMKQTSYIELLKSTQNISLYKTVGRKKTPCKHLKKFLAIQFKHFKQW